MKQDRWKLYLKVLWGAVIALIVISLLAGWIGGSDSWNAMLAGSVYVILNLGVLTMLFIIVVRIKEWIENQITNAAGQKSAVTSGELQMLRQSMDRIEAKVDRIEKVLDGLSD